VFFRLLTFPRFATRRENGLLRQLTKALMERALEAEMATHLGYQKSDPVEKPDANRRNGRSKKTMKGDFGELEITTPRDREATFEPRLIGKGQTRMAAWMARSSRCTHAA
jgi:putative transposase